MCSMGSEYSKNNNNNKTPPDNYQNFIPDPHKVLTYTIWTPLYELLTE